MMIGRHCRSTRLSARRSVGIARAMNAPLIALLLLLLSGCTTTRIVPVDDRRPFGPTAVGDRVRIELAATGEPIVGRVTAIEPDRLVVDGRPVTVAEMRSLHLEEPDKARTASVGTGAFAGVVFGPALVLIVLLLVFGGFG